MIKAIVNSNFLIHRAASDAVLDTAFDWLIKRRADYSFNSDVWVFRLLWTKTKHELQCRLTSGEYDFEAMDEYRFSDKLLDIWTSEDSLVLKALSIVLAEYLGPLLSGRCFHLTGRGGAKAAVREVEGRLKPGMHVMKSDVKSYYASMDHHVLYGLAEQYIPDKYVLRLIWGYMNRTVCYGGLYREVMRGISLGCPLSPLMGALYLKPLDDAVKQTGLFYTRFMDDWIVIAPTRWKLRHVVRVVNETLNILKVEQHPDKTFIGRADRGVSFLGYFIMPGRLTVSRESIFRFDRHIAQLYEQGADAIRIGQYVGRWLQWVRCGVCHVLTPLDAVLCFSVSRADSHGNHDYYSYRCC
ncbi:reverse transcriptase domain-containing protein [Desulfobacterales bacterium HSG16]|nr:reverse transcriptase domain-containing protein [Desulfobacterales bacterium HSG16]